MAEQNNYRKYLSTAEIVFETLAKLLKALNGTLNPEMDVQPQEEKKGK